MSASVIFFKQNAATHPDQLQQVQVDKMSTDPNNVAGPSMALSPAVNSSSSKKIIDDHHMEYLLKSSVLTRRQGIIKIGSSKLSALSIILASLSGFMAVKDPAWCEEAAFSNRILRMDETEPVNLFEIHDTNTYSGLVYVPKEVAQQDRSNSDAPPKKFPVLFILHGAGKNELNVWNLANMKGEHGGLAPSLLASKQAPRELYENFVVIAPYARGKASFYEEPRSKILQFIEFSLSTDGGGAQGIDLDKVDTDCKFLLGFSDGATLGVELMTTRKFAAGVFCAYGFTGKLPQLALERLKGIPMWIFHSADDVIFPVKCSDQLIQDLRAINKDEDYIIRYMRYDEDPEKLGDRSPFKGHLVGIAASKNNDVYKWLLSIQEQSKK